MRKFATAALAACLLSCLVAPARAQFTFSKVRLTGWIDLTTLNASSGNHCWGYTSPSGREYAIMGCSNKVAFVEITDPENPDYFAYISHGSSTWADITVYQDVCYVVTERSGSGIQVIDLANIDAASNRVSLVRTITEVGRSHTVRSDSVSGFLYTNGSRESPGSTTCWSLANPRNPVRVGVDSMTGGTYVHDSYVMTYPAGSAYPGRQVMFASSAFDGLIIYDVTDKNNPYIIKSVTYPNVGYTHQSWISEDLKYMYLDDEFDETTYGLTTRTLVFDVENLENAAYASSYTNGNTAIDHNLTIRDGYVCSSNYTSGLRIWSTHVDPLNPVEVGWFDTHPEGDVPEYEGTWANWSGFPSGTIILSDINRGLFVFDASEAMTRTIPPKTYVKVRGTQTGGNLASFASDDGNRLTLQPGVTLSTSQAPIEFYIETKADSTTPRKLDMKVDSRASSSVIRQQVEFYNFVTNSYEVVNSRQLSTTDTTVTITPTGDLDRFVDNDKKVRVRFRFYQTNPVLTYPYTVGVDQAVWINTP